MPLPSNASTILATFQRAGYSPAQAAGMLGNLRKEGGPNIDPGIKDPSGRSLGIAQWINERRAGLEKYAKGLGKSATDLQTQADYLVHELNTTEKRAGDLLKKTTMPTQAAQVFQKEFERPKNLDAERAAFAASYYKDVQDYYNKAKGATKPTAPPPVSNVDKAKSALQSAQQKAQDLLNQTLDKVKALQGGQSQSSSGSSYNPSSSQSNSSTQQIANASWDQSYIDAANKVKAAQGDLGNIAKNFNPTTNYYSNIASAAFPQFSNNLASNYSGSNFGNTLTSSFGNSFTNSFG